MSEYIPETGKPYEIYMFRDSIVLEKEPYEPISKNITLDHAMEAYPLFESYFWGVFNTIDEIVNHYFFLSQTELSVCHGSELLVIDSSTNVFPEYTDPADFLHYCLSMTFEEVNELWLEYILKNYVLDDIFNKPEVYLKVVSATLSGFITPYFMESNKTGTKEQAKLRPHPFNNGSPNPIALVNCHILGSHLTTALSSISFIGRDLALPKGVKNHPQNKKEEGIKRSILYWHSKNKERAKTMYAHEIAVELCFEFPEVFTGDDGEFLDQSSNGRLAKRTIPRIIGSVIKRKGRNNKIDF